MVCHGWSPDLSSIRLNQFSPSICCCKFGSESMGWVRNGVELQFGNFKTHADLKVAWVRIVATNGLLDSPMKMRTGAMEMLTKPLIVAWVCYFGRDSCCLQIDAVMPALGRNAGPLLPGCYDQSGRGRCLNGRPCRWVLIWASWSLEARSMPLGWATAEMGTRNLELGHRSGFRGAPAVFFRARSWLLIDRSPSDRWPTRRCRRLLQLPENGGDGMDGLCGWVSPVAATLGKKEHRNSRCNTRIKISMYAEGRALFYEIVSDIFNDFIQSHFPLVDASQIWDEDAAAVYCNCRKMVEMEWTGYVDGFRRLQPLWGRRSTGTRCSCGALKRMHMHVKLGVPFTVPCAPSEHLERCSITFNWGRQPWLLSGDPNPEPGSSDHHSGEANDRDRRCSEQSNQQRRRRQQQQGGRRLCLWPRRVTRAASSSPATASKAGGVFISGHGKLRRQPQRPTPTHPTADPLSSSYTGSCRQRRSTARRTTSSGDDKTNSLHERAAGEIQRLRLRASGQQQHRPFPAQATSKWQQQVGPIISHPNQRQQQTKATGFLKTIKWKKEQAIRGIKEGREGGGLDGPTTRWAQAGLVAHSGQAVRVS
ncbi:hypothetical protein ACLOJK_036540 [Asimina triloba]